MDFTGERFIVDSCPNKKLFFEHWHRYLWAGEFTKNKKVLDIACGSGYGSHHLSQYAKQVVGCDISEESVAYANEKYKSQNLTFSAQSITSLNFNDAEFDVIVSFETIEHIDDIGQHQALKEIKRIIKSDGLFIVSTPFIESRQYVKDNLYHKKEFYFDEYINFLKKYFKHVAILGQTMAYSSIIGKCSGNIVGFNENPNYDKFNDKYLIAVCSDIKLEEIPSSILIDRDLTDFFKKSFSKNKSVFKLICYFCKIIFYFINYKTKNNKLYLEKIEKIINKFYR